MHKKTKILISLVVLLCGFIIYAIPYIKMEFAESAHYTEKDTREYSFYTPAILQEMPRISQKYEFSFINVSGPASHVNVVKFYGTMDSTKVDEYLLNKGFKKQDKCDIEATCWRGSDPQETVYVNASPGENMVIVQVVNDFS
ncbi:hypothetical protein EHJ13_06330 [Cronobacter dublinensis]|uniref:Uncharacterized protein n=1 Tax=Cronobacter dublinensis TaxID=413497 RepID=A0A9Q4SZ77_9ENTR|nr:hypothetical protein [Cronobacter dublinensis]NCH87065.1 hypothetical protein [Cronobacter dublinensis]